MPHNSEVFGSFWGTSPNLKCVIFGKILMRQADRPIIVADAMSVGDDDGDEGENGRQRQQPGGRTFTDDVQHQTDGDVEEPRHQQ